MIIKSLVRSAFKTIPAISGLEIYRRYFKEEKNEQSGGGMLTIPHSNSPDFSYTQIGMIFFAVEFIGAYVRNRPARMLIAQAKQARHLASQSTYNTKIRYPYITAQIYPAVSAEDKKVTILNRKLQNAAKNNSQTSVILKTLDKMIENGDINILYPHSMSEQFKLMHSDPNYNLLTLGFFRKRVLFSHELYISSFLSSDNEFDSLPVLVHEATHAADCIVAKQMTEKVDKIKILAADFQRKIGFFKSNHVHSEFNGFKYSRHEILEFQSAFSTDWSALKKCSTNSTTEVISKKIGEVYHYPKYQWHDEIKARYIELSHVLGSDKVKKYLPETTRWFEVQFLNKCEDFTAAHRKV